ncbi:DNA polymerase III subunit delta' [Rhodocyclus tenuis]|uniref:DNA polymerase III subunit delta' n=1 Tax=Rhodocyclus gracilis TaxID=2929842 RepID=UPI001298A233|nr:DNA polymerase III subunit delta' [Rhodocyclus gracilis]MRD72815.1 DNA polymerase III subunit delta' [Rhodocyclus gracilis]
MKITELHENVWSGLLARRERLPHALLFAGQQGVGKFELARAFIAFLLCESPAKMTQACGHCVACNWLAQGNHPDFRLLQPAALSEAADAGEDVGKEAGEAKESSKRKPSAQITIDQVRGLDDFLHVGAHRNGVRVVLVTPAEAMNRATANALLKSLEEPAAGILFLLVSSEPARLLPTIRSRCQTVPIPTPARELAARWLGDLGVDDAERWLALAGGAPLRAVELGRSGAPADGRALLDALSGELARGDTLDALASAAALDRVVKAEKALSPLPRLVDWLQHWLFDLTLTSCAHAPRYFVREQGALKRLAVRTTLPRLLAFERKAIQYRAEAEQPLNSRLFLEELMMSYAALFSPSLTRDPHAR